MRRALVFLLLWSSGTAAASEEAPGRAMVVGTKPSPPFVVKQPDGTWGGLAIELWKLVATDLGVRVTIRPFEQVSALLDAVERGEVDVAVGAITVTPDRERAVDFSVPIYSTGLAIAVRPDRGDGYRAVARRLLGWQLAAALAALAILAGALFALVRRRERLQRAAAALWLIAAIVVVSGLASWVGAAAAGDQLAETVRGPDDLAHVRVTTVPGSTSAGYLEGRHIRFQPVATPQDGLRAVADGKADAIVYDAPIMSHLLRTGQATGPLVLPGVFERQDYAFVVSEGSPLRVELDRHLRARIEGDTWRQLRARYLGEE